MAALSHLYIFTFPRIVNEQIRKMGQLIFHWTLEHSSLDFLDDSLCRSTLRIAASSIKPIYQSLTCWRLESSILRIRCPEIQQWVISAFYSLYFLTQKYLLKALQNIHLFVFIHHFASKMATSMLVQSLYCNEESPTSTTGRFVKNDVGDL